MAPLSVRPALTAEQWDIFSAIADTVVPSFSLQASNRLLQHPLSREIHEAACRRLQQGVDSEDAQELIASYLGEKATAQQDFRESINRLLTQYCHDDAYNKLTTVLTALNTRAGALLLTGYSSPLDCLPVSTRERIIQRWSTSLVPVLRQLHVSLTSLSRLYWIRTSPTLGRTLSFPRIPAHPKGPETFYSFNFLQIPSASKSNPVVLQTDVVIVGSGCGGAVAAKTLAEAGLKVIVVDKGSYWSPKHLPRSELDGFNELFLNGGAMQSDDNGVAVLAGSTWGGGGTVNWSASIQTQGFVRREWSEKFGLTHFTSAAFQADLDAICERMGVGTSAIEHNKANRVLLEGARRLGWAAKPVPQNTAGEAHYCGYCTLGCGSCGKKGPTETFLPDAARAGAVFIEGFKVRNVVFEESSDASERVVTGVEGVWTPRDNQSGAPGAANDPCEVIIKASKVIIAAGTLATPVLLRRSGLTNPHIGRHLHLHPVSFVGAVWDQDVRPWEGGILTSVVTEFENLDHQGYGAKLESTTMLPSLFLPLFPWRSGLQFKEFAAKMKRMTGYISLARDRYGGRVYPDPKDGRIRLQYVTSQYDRTHILEGVVRLAELLYVQGAREIFTAIPSVDSFVRPTPDPESKVHVTSNDTPSVNDVEFGAWLQRVRKAGLSDTLMASAHQMGSCRMGTSASTSVVDPKGRVWGTTGLYICDASVFPSASGVNPMVTCMGISRGIARQIAEEVTGVRARL
ncbi:hypothetical protein BAUCODRAFT_274597 [Baudoinia panamericana UAMH 10762]|uniref:Long-chain-alcohol oxidase n=1 Tax=Baudoinia panamericana (strain UAMH 10762) TaxID=717646 RepID=M2M6Z5_BAUPA|nr:uncharacterized protein BAUCODRAFT_274597 [Baudoinia panamericana UAMH 10762]EMC92046.1 hypothetical protein BAUCODRAFT_274597 [Baudoinia panamericana UAMH 10762]